MLDNGVRGGYLGGALVLAGQNWIGKTGSQYSFASGIPYPVNVPCLERKAGPIKVPG